MLKSAITLGKSAMRSGIAGLSIEDSVKDGSDGLYDFYLAVERMRAARRAIDKSGTGVLLVGRSEGFIAGRPDLEETIRRLVAYAEAGGGVPLRAGTAHDRRHSRGAVVQAVAPKPVNAGVGSDFTTVAEMAEIGVRRISVGGALARAAWGGFLAAAREIAEKGTFTASGGGAGGRDERVF